MNYRRYILIWCSMFFFALACAGSATAKQVRIVLVGVPYYEDLNKAYSEYQDLFPEAEYDSVTYTFKIAVGTYDEVLYWYQNDLIDLAVLSPGAVSDLLTSSAMGEKLNELYIGSRALRPEKNQPFLTDKRSLRFNYQPLCVVRRGEKGEPLIKNARELMDKGQQGQLRLLFVHPLSVSGRILPELWLKEHNVDLKRNEVEWTYNHRFSLQMLNEGNKKKDGGASGKIDVAFIWDATTLEDSDGINVKDLYSFPFPDESSWVPQEILVCTRKFASPDLHNKTIMGEILQVTNSASKFYRLDGWLSEYAELVERVKQLKSLQPVGDRAQLISSSISLEQIGARLRNYAYSHSKKNDPHPLRLAVVLSGGGAKCAYQLGVMKALELELQKIRDKDSALGINKESNVDVSLVVGTSGGALNALAVALGLTRKDADQVALHNTWVSLDQGDFFQLWPLVHIFLGLVFGLLQATVTFVLVIRIGRWDKDWWKLSALIILGLAVVEFLVSRSGWTPWSLLGGLGKNHFWHHLWLIGTLSFGWASLCLIFIAAMLWLFGWQLPLRKNRELNLYRRKILYGATFCIIIFSTIIFALTLFQQAALSDSSGMERALVEKYSKLLYSKGLDADKLNDIKDTQDKLHFVSRHIITESLLQRDLVITDSRLLSDSDSQAASNMSASGTLPSDLYFYYTNNKDQITPDKSTPPDKRFVPLNENIAILLDVVIGSGSIYPLFLPRKFDCFKGKNDNDCTKLYLIDGGFTHNSPIEAAIKWDATHIIVIEASPQERLTLQSNLLDNSFTAFNYLFSQAQNLDANMYGQRETFVIRPRVALEHEDPNLDTFDFSEHFIKGAIDKGLNDALNTADPRFRREPGQPHF